MWVFKKLHKTSKEQNVKLQTYFRLHTFSLYLKTISEAINN